MRPLLICVFAVSALAGEHAVLTTGYRLHADRHETAGGVVRLHAANGVIEFPESAIARFEVDEYVAPPPLPPMAPVAVVAPAKAVEVSKSSRELVEDAAARAGLPPAIVHSVAKAESGYRSDAVSKKGAVGLMQLMPGTAAQLSADPNNPKENADAGAMYLREMLIRYDGDVPKALAAYNAGPAAVDKYRGVPPYAETVSYVNRVIRDYKKRSGD